MPFSLAMPLSSAVSLSISASSRSAGRQVTASAPSSTRACSSLLNGAGAAPYSPFKMPAVSLVIDLYRSQIGRTAGNGFSAIQYARLQLFIERCRRCAIFTLQDAGSFLGDRLVALTGQHVDHRLGANDLRGRGHQRDKTEVFAYPRDLCQHFIELVL